MSAQHDPVSKWVQVVLGLFIMCLVVVIPLLVALTEEEPEPAAVSGASPVPSFDTAIPEMDDPLGEDSKSDDRRRRNRR